jgi:hypothetical protein
MSWDKKPSGSTPRFYYYRSRREGLRAVKTYVGPGVVGEEAAKRDAEARRRREQRKREWSATWATIEQSRQPLNDFCRSMALIVKAVLIASGYYQHARSQWRRRGTTHE